MSSRFAQQPAQARRGFPTWLIITLIVLLVIVSIIAIVSFIQLQSCIVEARNNVCQNSPGANAPPPPTCCVSNANCPEGFVCSQAQCVAV